MFRYRPSSSSLLKATLLICAVLCWKLLSINEPPPDEPKYTFYPLKYFNESSANDCYNESLLTPHDFVRLIDLDNFEFLLNNFVCNKSDNPLLLILVFSAPANFRNRQIIRQSWGGDHRLIKLAFLLGNADTDHVQQKIAGENDLRRDIIQGNFVDAYRNLTYKHVMALKWVTYFCFGAKYILKMDDDTFVNTPGLLKFLIKDISPLGARKLIMCAPVILSPVCRSYRSKWRVSPAEYSAKMYPTYCLGWGILYSPDVVFELYREAQVTKYFWIEDVHVTGTLVERINVSQVSFRSLVLSVDQVKNIVSGSKSIGSYLFGPPNLSCETMEELWMSVIENVYYLKGNIVTKLFMKMLQ